MQSLQTEQSDQIPIQNLTKAHIRYLLIEALDQTQIDSETLEWVRSLCEELSTRIKNLTPNNIKFQREWDQNFDIDLIIQMLKHNAFEEDDCQNLVSVVFERLSKCCAPVQDEAVAHAKEAVLREVKFSSKMACMIEIAHCILEDIETLGKKFQESVDNS